MSIYEYNREKHVTFPLLGKFGRFGNQLFQIAATIAHARRLNLEARFPVGTWRSEFQHFGLNSRNFMIDPIGWIYIWEEEIDPAPWNFEPIPDYVRALCGYYQSPRYWYGECPLRLLVEGEAIPLVSHVRRGDYLKVPDHHPPLPDRYYIDAAYSHGCGVEVGEESLNIPGWEHRNGTLWEDFVTLCRAETLIISNSSFALWAAYLGRARRVYYPVPWFGPALQNHNASQLIPDSKEKEWTPVEWMKG